MPPIHELIDIIRAHPKLILVDDYELTIQDCTSRTKKYRNGQANLHSVEHQLWVSLRVSHRKRGGRASTFFRDKQSLLRLVDRTMESAERATPDPWFRFPLWKAPKSSIKKLPPFPASESSFYGELRWTPDVLDEVYEDWEIETILCRKTEKFQLTHKKNIQSVHFGAAHHFGDHRFSLRESRAACETLDEKQRAEWLAHLLGRVCRREGGRFFRESADTNLLVSPNVGAALLEKMGRWFCADQVQSGVSPLAGLQGEKIFSDAVTLIDDGTYPGALHSMPFDLEGTQTQKTVLVEKGVWKNSLYDTYSATKENRLSTGNVLRALNKAEVELSPGNLMIAPSDLPRSELAGALPHCLYLDELESIERGSGDGKITLRGMGWRLENGEFVEPLWQVGFEVDAKTLFSQVVSTGNDFHFYGPYGSPSILFEKIPLELR